MALTVKQERGMAVVMALLLVALAASAASLVLWQQSLWWHQVESDRQRAQMRLWLDAEISWAQSRLKDSPVVAHSQPWAQALAAIEAGYLLRANLQDLQGRLNLNALAGAGGVIDLQQLTYYRGLLQQLALPASLADSLIRWRGLRFPQTAGEPVLEPLPLRHLARWESLQQVPGYSTEVLARLEPYASLLADEINTVNLNTAPLLLLQVMLPEVPPGRLSSVVAQRDEHYFRDAMDFKQRLNHPLEDVARLTTRSSFFCCGARYAIVRNSLASAP